MRVEYWWPVEAVIGGGRARQLFEALYVHIRKMDAEVGDPHTVEGQKRAVRQLFFQLIVLDEIAGELPGPQRLPLALDGMPAELFGHQRVSGRILVERPAEWIELLEGSIRIDTARLFEQPHAAEIGDPH